MIGDRRLRRGDGVTLPGGRGFGSRSLQETINRLPLSFEKVLQADLAKKLGHDSDTERRKAAIRFAKSEATVTVAEEDCFDRGTQELIAAHLDDAQAGSPGQERKIRLAPA